MIHWDINVDTPKTIIYFQAAFVAPPLQQKNPAFCVGKNPRFDLVWISNGFITNLVQGIGGIGNQLAQEDLLVAVEGVDDQAWYEYGVG